MDRVRQSTTQAPENEGADSRGDRLCLSFV
jgi:hypothetical protein